MTDVPSTSTQSFNVRPAVFAAHLGYLQRHGFTGLTLGELYERYRTAQPLPARPIVLTFDDGYADFRQQALPMLIEHRFPATVFVTTGWLHDSGPYFASRPPGRMLSLADLTELSAAGVEVGAHSHSHPELDQIPEPRLRAELAGPKRMLEDVLGQPVCSLAYPYGYSNKRVRDVSREVGYLQAASVANAAAHPRCDPFRVPRLSIRRSTSPSGFESIVNRKNIRLHYAPAYVLTAGWFVVRRTRSAVRPLRRKHS